MIKECDRLCCCPMVIVRKSQFLNHYSDIMDTISSQITSLTIVYSTVYSDADQRKHQSSAPLAFVCGTGEFPTQIASNAENVSIWWRHHVENRPQNLGSKLEMLPLHTWCLDFIHSGWVMPYSSILSHIMACCLTAPSHNLNQCWHKVIGIHPSEISHKICRICWPKLPYKMKLSKVGIHLPGENKLNRVALASYQANNK